MPYSERIRRHLQGNVVGYIALFVALSGTALALPGKNNVKSKNIARGAVKGKALADGAVATVKIRNGAVTSSKLGAGAVLEGGLADGSVTSDKLADDSVVRQKILQGTINGGKLANGAVDSAKVANGSLLGEDFSPGQLVDGFLNGPSALGGTTTQVETTSIETERPGRLLVFANFTSNVSCNSPGCNRNYVLEVDDVRAPGSVFTVVPLGTELNTYQPVTIFGLTANVPAGTHDIDLEAQSIDVAGVTEAQRSIGALLLE